MSKRKNTSLEEIAQKKARLTQPEVNTDGEGVVGPSQSNGVHHAPRTTAEVGIVESISLKNFMCHSCLGPFAFGPNVNFIIGNNGSGKSAVLTALIVGLGGKAQNTNRGSSLKGFVKEGESSADVSITLRNRGEDAYKPEAFGQVITVDLRISSEGLRTYKLKSSSGHVVSTKKEELLCILDHFNIQVDNPVSILTQEMSKHFLHSKGEQDKYRFFMKATQLEQMKEDYSYIKKTKTVTKNTVEKHEECLEVLKRKYQEKEDCFKSLASLDDMHKKLQELQNQMAWALVMEMEKEVEPLRNIVANEDNSTAKYEQKVEEWRVKVVEAERKYKATREQLEGVAKRVQELQPQCTALKAEAQTRSKALKEAEASFHRCKSNLRDLEKDKQQLTKRINELKHSISQKTGAESQRRAQRMEELQAELEALEFQSATLTQQVEQFHAAASRAKEEHGKLREEERELQQSVAAKQRELRALEASRSDRMGRFGEQMPPLLAAIDSAHRNGHFKKKPVGPLGDCVRLRDPELALAVESCLKSLVQAFCCDNHNDEKVLQGLMARHFSQGRRPQIVVSQFSPTVYNIHGRAVDMPQFPSVLKALEIKDPVVANCLIDMRGIETVLLIKNKQEARQVMQKGRPPRNCREAFTKEGDQVYTNRYYSSDQQRAKYLSHDVEEEIRHNQQELQNREAKRSRFSLQMQKVEEDIRQNEGLKRKAYEDQRKKQESIRRIQLEMADLQNVEEPQSEDLKPLEEELTEISSKIAAACRDRDEIQQQMAQLKTAFEEAELNYSKQKEAVTSITEEAEPIKEELAVCDQEVEKSKHHKKHYEEKRKAHDNKVVGLKASLEAKEQELKSAVEEASKIFAERLNVRRTAKSLDTEISRLKVKISSQQDQQGDRVEIIRQYKDAMEKYKNVLHQVKSLKRFVLILEKIMDDRHKVYAEMRMYLSVRSKYYFHSMLSQRGYTGQMMFDHKEETLSISVQPGEGDKASLSDMRSLSGGERSFSTVCFVLSLWAIAETPFRCLDEFDVYMDMVNRRISMDMMLKIAASQQYRQFIFLTPQSMSLERNHLINVLKLNDPDRGQNSQRDQESDQDHEG